jgi:acetyl-CoA C-acetyltransferase
MKRVAICAVAQHEIKANIWHKRFQDMLLDILEDLQGETGFTFGGERGVKNVITCSDDFFDARTISDNAVNDVVGAGNYRGEQKMAQEGLNGIGYAMAAILSGHDDVIYLAGHCKESLSTSRNQIANMAYDPFYGRCLGLDYLNTAGLQARAYMEKTKITQEQLAKVVVRARQWASRNPYANEKTQLNLGDVMYSPVLCDPIRSLHAYPVSDGAVGMLLASEERAYEFTDNPIWITGFGNCMDSYFLGRRDIASSPALKKAAGQAYRMAGISKPRESINLVEVMDCYAHQQPMWLEGLGLCDEGKGGDFIDAYGPARYNVNLSGGMLAGRPLMIGGLYGVAEAVLQLKGQANEHQAADVSCAAIQSTTGGAGQFQTVAVLER